MRKRRYWFMVCSVLFTFLFPGLSLAVCAVEAPIPAGGFSWPAKGEVVNGWSLDCGSDRGHRGIDIATAPGDQISATAAGIVTFTGYTPAEGGGTTISITHDGGLRSTYLHIGEITVAAGQQVDRGEVIGVSTGAPVHFGLKLPGVPSDAYLNPLEFLPPTAETRAGPHADFLAAPDAVIEEATAPAPPSPVVVTEPDAVPFLSGSAVPAVSGTAVAVPVTPHAVPGLPPGSPAAIPAAATPAPGLTPIANSRIQSAISISGGRRLVDGAMTGMNRASGAAGHEMGAVVAAGGRSSPSGSVRTGAGMASIALSLTLVMGSFVAGRRLFDGNEAGTAAAAL